MPVLKTSDIAPGELVGVTQDGQELLIAADLKGSIYATANICPHLGTPLDQGSINAAGALVCPLHKSAFSLEDGKLVGDWCPFPPVLGPLVLGRLEPAKDLAVFPVRASGGNIQVRVFLKVAWTFFFFSADQWKVFIARCVRVFLKSMDRLTNERR